MDWQKSLTLGARRLYSAVRAASIFVLHWTRRALVFVRTLATGPRTRSSLAQGRAQASRAWRTGGRGFAGAAICGGLVWFLTVAAGRLALHPVRPGEIGVRVSEWGGSGIAQRDFAPGLHLSLFGLHAWHRLPAGTQWVSWRAAGLADSSGLLGVRTQDGNEVLVAVSVPFRILPGQAHRIVTESHRNTYRELTRARSEAVLLTELGKLSSEDFTATDVRREVLVAALAALNESLASVHVVAEAILVEAVRFPGPYEKKLQETQLEKLRGKMLSATQAVSEEEQTVALARREMNSELQARRIGLDMELQRLRLEAEDELEQVQRETEAFVARTRALADREYKRLALEGQAEKLSAKALEAELTQAVYASEGGQLYLAAQAARATHIQTVTLDASDPRVPNLLDPVAMARLFSGK
ncbi:MAG: SPFH domain-containing protein [bacterium]|nr:hypothetical protein [Planctomycetota bacterium]HIL51757.1 hypothetical protein [Planctomycetota bacterium]